MSQTLSLWSSAGGVRHSSLICSPISISLSIFTLFFIASLFILDIIYLGPSLAALEASFLPSFIRPSIVPLECNLFNGSWVFDKSYPLYTECPFIEQGFQCPNNGRQNLTYRNWRWQPFDCNIPRFDAMSMLMRLRDQRVAFVGDSMGRTQWESLVCLLMNGVHDKWSVKEIHGKNITKTTPHLAVLFPGFNVTIEYYRSRWLVHIGQPPKHAPKRVKATLKLDTLESASSQWQTANVLVFNSGHWWTAAKTYRFGRYFQVGSSLRLGMDMESAYRTAVATWADWVKQYIDTNKTHVFFRNYEPHSWGHLNDWEEPKKHKTECPIQTAPIFNESHIRLSSQAQVLEQLWGSLQVKATLLDITRLSAYRRDAHIFNFSTFRAMDCSHWCLPGVPDTWNELLYTLLLRDMQHASHSW
ncbi:hypothetical protein BDL97_07G033600 [Sphagnum fallax]|nr:hypothetical protein BDL97_07G033600 [Sphagnum fallax]